MTNCSKHIPNNPYNIGLTHSGMLSTSDAPPEQIIQQVSFFSQKIFNFNRNMRFYCLNQYATKARAGPLKWTEGQILLLPFT